MAGIAMSHSSCLPLPSWPSSVLGPTPRPKKRDRGLNRSIVLDPLVNPGNQAHRHEACAAAHLARTLTRLVVMAQGSSSQRAQGPSQEEIATVVLEEQRRSPDLNALSFEERIGLLVDREAAERDTKRLTTRLKFAALRQSACVEDVDWRTPRGIDRAVFARLIGGDWIDRNENLLVTGATGLGKSWIACALGHKACRDNRSVVYHRVPRLLEALALARGDGRYGRLLKAIGRVQLLILDDWGLAPLTGEQRRDLLEIMDDRHERGSTIVTSQLPVDHWHEVIGDPTIADAVLDRLVHNAHRLLLKGESLRKRAAKA